MRGKSEYPARHGDQHAPDGSDPIAGIGGGLQYNVVDVYGPHNIGDWLNVATTAAPDGEHYGMLFQAGTVENSAGIALLTSAWTDVYIDHGSWVDLLLKGQDIALSTSKDAGHVGPEWYLSNTGILYYLAGAQDLGYTEGGFIIRYTRGGDYLVYTTEGGFNGSGDIQFTTSGAADASTSTAGQFIVDTSNIDHGNSGDISLLAPGDSGKEGGILIQTKSGAPSLPNGSIKIRAAEDLTLSADGDINVNATGAATVNGDLGVTGVLNTDTVTNPSGSLTVSALTDLYVQPGGNEVHDLQDTQTLVINDHLGSPLVTYTG